MFPTTPGPTPLETLTEDVLPVGENRLVAPTVLAEVALDGRVLNGPVRLWPWLASVGTWFRLWLCVRAGGSESGKMLL